jgi:hypothetical protein
MQNDRRDQPTKTTFNHGGFFVSGWFIPFAV